MIGAACGHFSGTVPLQVSAHVVVFPGGAGTFLEVSKLVFALAYPTEQQPLPERVILVGGESYWAGLKAQLNTREAVAALAGRDLFEFYDARIGRDVRITPDGKAADMDGPNSAND